MRRDTSAVGASLALIVLLIGCAKSDEARLDASFRSGDAEGGVAPNGDLNEDAETADAASNMQSASGGSHAGASGGAGAGASTGGDGSSAMGGSGGVGPGDLDASMQGDRDADTSSGTDADVAGDGDAGVSEPSPYAGYWVGTTDRGRAIGFTVSTDGYIDSLIVFWRVNLGSSSCTGPAVASVGRYLIEDGHFDVPVLFPGSNISSVVHGVFAADGAAVEGDYDGHDEGFSAVCGRTLTIGSCCALASSTWTAARGVLACTLANDGECDDPEGSNLCLRGTDSADCDASQCARNADTCDDEPDACIDTAQGFSCACGVGYSGDGVGSEGCIDIDECAAPTSPCDQEPLAECSNTTGGFQCLCPHGSIGSGEGASGCEPDNCLANDCDDSPPATCVDGDASYACACPPGYVGNGHGESGCRDVNECLDQPPRCDVAPMATCANVDGDFMCSCPAGYSGDGIGSLGCTEDNECLLGTDDCDESPIATCANTTGSFTCECPSGSLGDGRGADGCTSLCGNGVCDATECFDCADDCPAGCPACTHDLCAEGPALVADCDECVARTCEDDPFCCSDYWDDTCVGRAAACDSSCDEGLPPACADGCPSCTHSLCEAGAALTASCDACVESICALDSFCCTAEWDELCIGSVLSTCRLSC